jgi:3-keto-L-gulonate-6-phosphate decarboxylase
MKLDPVEMTLDTSKLHEEIAEAATLQEAVGFLEPGTPLIIKGYEVTVNLTINNFYGECGCGDDGKSS